MPVQLARRRRRADHWDAAAGFAYLTPANGAVVTPMAPLGQCDREAGTITVSTSRACGRSSTASAPTPRSPSPTTLVSTASPRAPSSCSSRARVASRSSRPANGTSRSYPDWGSGSCDRRGAASPGSWLDVYYKQRVPITIDVERVLVLAGRDLQGRARRLWSTAAGAGGAAVPPKNGIGPRVDVAKVRSGIESLPHSLLAWAGADGLPIVVSVRAKSGDAAVELVVAPEMCRRVDAALA